MIIAFRLKSREDLENYFQNHAKAMREDGLKRFGDKFTAFRRVLSLNSTF